MHVDHFSWTGTDWNTATHEWIMIPSHAFVISDPRPQRHVTYRSYRPYQHPKRNRVMYRLCGGSDRPTDRTNRALRHASATKQKQTDKRTDHHPVIKLYMYLPPHSQCEQNSSHACFSALHAIAHARACARPCSFQSAASNCGTSSCLTACVSSRWRLALGCVRGGAIQTPSVYVYRSRYAVRVRVCLCVNHGREIPYRMCSECPRHVFAGHKHAHLVNNARLQFDVCNKVSNNKVSP